MFFSQNALMVNDLLKLNVVNLQTELERLTDDCGLVGNILTSEDGLVIIEAVNPDFHYDSTLISAMAASLISENHFGFSNPNEIILNYDIERIIINRLTVKKKDLNLLLISITPLKMRYFKRFLKKSIKLINKML